MIDSAVGTVLCGIVTGTVFCGIECCIFCHHIAMQKNKQQKKMRIKSVETSVGIRRITTSDTAELNNR